MNRRRSPTTSTTPCSMAGRRRSSTAGGAIDAAIASSVGADSAETTSRASTVPAGSPSRRSSMSSCRRSGIGGPFPGRHVASSAKERQPDLLGVEGVATRHLVEAEERGPREPVTHLVPEHPFDGVEGQRPDVNPIHAILGEGRDDAQGIVVRQRSLGRPPSRRSARPSGAERRTGAPGSRGRSIHWMSSMARTTGEVAATDRRHPRTARETARWSARAPELGDRRRATSSARRCGSGNDGSASSRMGSRRSPSAA